MRRSNWYQISLIALIALTAVLYFAFFQRELFPEYKIYQNAYVELENFRQSYTGEAFSPFEMGIKQILLKEGTAPEKIDRCTTCHVALDVEDYSPTRIQRDINGNILRDSYGFPQKEKNPDYIFTKLQEKIDDLEKSGQTSEADHYRSLMTAKVNDHVYDMEKVLVMHPLIGRETRPFENHPENQYGCVTCHSGNGRAITTATAHGPVFDEDYPHEEEGVRPEFIELDPKHDPQFAKVFNFKPNDKLLFQTTPILVGPLMEARCVQCHKPSIESLLTVDQKMEILANRRRIQSEVLTQSFNQGALAYLTLYQLSKSNVALTNEQTQYLQAQKDPKEALQDAMREYVGTDELVTSLNQELEQSPKVKTITKFIESHQGQGSLFRQYEEANLDNQLLAHFNQTQNSLAQAPQELNNLNKIVSDIDRLTMHYKRGKDLYTQQACYACHRIEGLSRGGIGPELTKEGLSYPWFIKESIVWPQADLKSSQMPNQKLDHEELQDLMTFLLAQRGKDHYTSSVEKAEYINAWERGLKQPFEKEINFSKLNDVPSALMTFAMEGCAACHKLEGYTSSVGYSIQKGKEPSFEELYHQSSWFKQFIPEDIGSSALVDVLNTHRVQLNEHISADAKEKGTLEMIEEIDPQVLASFYAPFKYALRAKEFNDPDAQKEWHDLVNRVMKVYYQEYGLGRMIGPRPNWSGIYRSNEWLMEHFWNPQSKIPRSLMPAMPFDDSKFWQLTHMLNTLGKRNRDEVRKIWNTFGFNPAQAYEIHCAQCHGSDLKGNGPVATWIYPIPMNLRNADFLRLYTKEETKEVIEHGVKGTPMPGWNETWKDKGVGFDIPVLTEDEIEILVDWIYDQLPVTHMNEEVSKWTYSTQNFVDELSVLNKNLGALSTESLFDHQSDHEHDHEPKVFFKEKFYTDQNLQQGKNLYLLNCAICHGTEGDGSGFRAESMQDAKPRVLTSVDWINAHDDLWVLRAIKYGVPGTSMISFGDITTPLQRMQLTMYVRSLSQIPRERQTLYHHIFQSYVSSEDALMQAKSAFAQDQGTKFTQAQEIAKSLEKEKEGFSTLGNAMVGNSTQLIDVYGNFLKSIGNRYVFENGQLKINNDPMALEKVDLNKMIKTIDDQEMVLKREIDLKKEKMTSKEITQDIEILKGQIESLEKLKKNIQTTFSENEILWENQKQILQSGSR